MIDVIRKEYCAEDLVQIKTREADKGRIFIDAREMLFASRNGVPLINKYEDNPNRENFLYNSVSTSTMWDRYYNTLLEYNKLYLEFSLFGDGYRFNSHYVFRGRDRAFHLDYRLPLDYGEENFNEEVISREEALDFFDYSNYDSMYVLNREGRILSAYSEKDGSIISKKIVPSDEEITELELNSRYLDEGLSSMLSISETEVKKLKSKSIDEITDFPIYGRGMFHRFYHILVTSNGGKFNANWFSLSLVKKDVFKLILGNVPVKEPNVDDVSEYINRNGLSLTKKI